MGEGTYKGLGTGFFRVCFVWGGGEGTPFIITPFVVPFPRGLLHPPHQHTPALHEIGCMGGWTDRSARGEGHFPEVDTATGHPESDLYWGCYTRHPNTHPLLVHRSSWVWEGRPWPPHRGRRLGPRCQGQAPPSPFNTNDNNARM